MADHPAGTARTTTHPGTGTGVEINKVLRNTYLLLGLTLAFSAGMAALAMAVNAPYMGLWTLLGWFGLLFAIHKTANSVWGLFWVFAFTGFLGFTIGPVVNFYLQTPNGADVVTLALGSTAAAFVGLSAIAVITRKDSRDRKSVV